MPSTTRTSRRATCSIRWPTPVTRAPTAGYGHPSPTAGAKQYWTPSAGARQTAPAASIGRFGPTAAG
jgi:hypothetical protein